MPCSDSSSSISLKLDSNEKFISFDFAKITCGREITANTGFSKFCAGRTLEDILKIPYAEAVLALGLNEEEGQYVLYLEWAALRSAVAQYLGEEAEEYEKDRCQIISIEQSDQGIEIAEVILPPKEMPKILPCNLGEGHQAA